MNIRTVIMRRWTFVCDACYEKLTAQTEKELEEFSTGNSFESKCDFCENRWTHWLVNYIEAIA